MRADQMPGWYETDDDRLDRLAGIVKDKRAVSEGMRTSNVPSDELARARASIAYRKAHAELLEAEDKLKAAVEAYDLGKSPA